MTYYTLWVARDENGALRIFDDEPVWNEEGGFWVRPSQTVRSPQASNVWTWTRKMPSHWFLELKPGEKVECRLEPEPG